MQGPAYRFDNLGALVYSFPIFLHWIRDLISPFDHDRSRPNKKKGGIDVATPSTDKTFIIWHRGIKEENM